MDGPVYVEPPRLCGRCGSSPGTVGYGREWLCEPCAADARADEVIAEARGLERFGTERFLFLGGLAVLLFVSWLVSRVLS